MSWRVEADPPPSAEVWLAARVLVGCGAIGLALCLWGLVMDLADLFRWVRGLSF